MNYLKYALVSNLKITNMTRRGLKVDLADMMVENPNIPELEINLEKNKYRNFTDLQKYHNLWGSVNFEDMLE